MFINGLLASLMDILLIIRCRYLGLLIPCRVTLAAFVLGLSYLSALIHINFQLSDRGYSLDGLMICTDGYLLLFTVRGCSSMDLLTSTDGYLFLIIGCGGIHCSG